MHNNGSVKETEARHHIWNNNPLPCFKGGVGKHILTPKTCVSALSHRASQHLETKMNVQCLSSPTVCTEKYPGLTMRSGMLITTHHRKIKMPTCVTTDLRGQIFSILNFFAHFPLRMSNARNISYLLVCVGTPGVLDGLKARSDQKKTLFPFRPRTRRTVKALDCESICICIQKQ